MIRLAAILILIAAVATVSAQIPRKASAWLRPVAAIYSGLDISAHGLVYRNYDARREAAAETPIWTDWSSNAQHLMVNDPANVPSCGLVGEYQAVSFSAGQFYTNLNAKMNWTNVLYVTVLARTPGEISSIMGYAGNLRYYLWWRENNTINISGTINAAWGLGTYTNSGRLVFAHHVYGLTNTISYINGQPINSNSAGAAGTGLLLDVGRLRTTEYNQSPIHQHFMLLEPTGIPELLQKLNQEWNVLP